MREESDSQTVLATGDKAVAEIARRQHGVVSLAQLRAVGLGDGAVKWRSRRGRLHPLHRGVYAVGHARLTPQGRLWAAALAFPRGALSHHSAASVWDLCPVPARLDVSTTGASRCVKGVRVHRVHTLDATAIDGLPVTTLPRTLIDLAAEGPVTRYVARADQLRILDVAALGPDAGRPGARRLRTALDELGLRAGDVTRSELEERFLGLVARSGLPRPRVNQVVEGVEADFVWRRQRVVAETDGAATHAVVTGFERDRRRDAALTAAGWRVVRFTWRQVTREPDAVAGALRRLLCG